MATQSYMDKELRLAKETISKHVEHLHEILEESRRADKWRIKSTKVYFPFIATRVNDGIRIRDEKIKICDKNIKDLEEQKSHLQQKLHDAESKARLMLADLRERSVAANGLAMANMSLEEKIAKLEKELECVELRVEKGRVNIQNKQDWIKALQSKVARVERERGEAESKLKCKDPEIKNTNGGSM